MRRRAEGVAETRRRIVDATLAVHDEQGIAAARWADIAERAGVSPATVYRHFPTLEALVVACGHRTTELVDPPTPERAQAAFEGAATAGERIERLVRETFGFYERAGRVVDNVRRDRHRLPLLQEAHERFEAGLVALVEEALGPLGASPDDARLARALTDVRVWEALREHGLGAEATVDAGCALLRCALSA